jgi:predicted peptidase
MPGAGGGGAPAGPPSTRQTPKPLGGADAAPNGYFEYLPPGYTGSVATPLLVFWHGIGEDGNGGSELQKVLAHGPPKLIADDVWDNQRPFIVLSPQYSPKNGEIAAGGGCPSSAVIDAFITWALTHYEVDAKRVYLTGLSCGAIGSWDYLAEHRGSTVAAAVLLSGNPGDPTQAGSAWQRAGCALAEAAIWSLHGDADGVVPYAPDHDTLTQLTACPSPPRRDVTFTDVVNGQHDIWDNTYDLSAGRGDIYQWLLDNAKP